MAKNLNKIIIVTPTYPRKYRLDFLSRCVVFFSEIHDIQWIVVEDGHEQAPDVKNLLLNINFPGVYLHFGPTRDYGTSQRNHALSYIRDKDLEGVVYFADDDNYYHRRVFDEIRKTKKVSVFPVGHLGPRGIERPIVQNGRIVGWNCYWLSRKYPLDWAGIAFNTKVIKKEPAPELKGANYFDAIKNGKAEQSWTEAERIRWLRANKDGESEFLEKIIRSADDLEILCDNCRKCYVWHNQPLNENPVFTYYKRRLKNGVRNKYYLLRDINRNTGR